MPAQDWNYVENQFDIATQHSRKRMNGLALDHLAKLSAAAGNVHVSALFTRTQPLVLTWSELYKAWLNTAAVYEGAAANLESKLSELCSSRLIKWDTALASAYQPHSSKYLEILPNGREPFLSGTVDERIAEIRSFAARVRNLGDLDSLAREIETCGTDLESLRTVEQRLSMEVAHTQEALEPQRKLLATMLFRNLGAIIEIHAEDPAQVAAFFNFELLQATEEEDEDDMVTTAPGAVTYMAPMIGSTHSPVAVTGRRVTPPDGSSL
ncbi:hypothetical protein ACXR0O_16790 [Verrucomicrobiota bacterium sgz303538]